MKKVKAAAGDSVKGDIQEQDRQEFKDARKFQYTKDTVKVKTLSTDPSARGIIFVPAPNSIPQDQPLNNAPIPAPASAPASPPAADPDAVANINRRLDALLGKIKDLTTDNNELKGEIAVLKDKMATSEKSSEERDADNNELKKEIAELKEKVTTWQKLSEEREAAYDDIRGWLVTNDTKYMDRLRLRYILDLGQARLARFADLPIDLPQSQHARALSRAWRTHLAQCTDDDDRLARARELLIACPDVETTSMPDSVMQFFTDYPSNIRNAGDRTAHPAQVIPTTYSEVVAHQPDDQRTLIQASIAYGLKFRP
ncbi:hypothetical protein ARMSODRAFT_966963 [Armillaria solidipes]|uniref:Uncharacterized protein n=1 Tax=Armillaria solidipes TaxID=1076256 RepID=A0A2H3AWS8_9AGAR|nr:hypothetical protein ARMSODRAFT_966963 [Armillaria solidipes]